MLTTIDSATKGGSPPGFPRSPGSGTHDDPESVSHLFSDVLGDAASRLKCAGRMAQLLEHRFIVDGWPVGQNYGCEIDLAQQFDTGRARCVHLYKRRMKGTRPKPL